MPDKYVSLKQLRSITTVTCLMLFRSHQ